MREVFLAFLRIGRWPTFWGLLLVLCLCGMGSGVRAADAVPAKGYLEAVKYEPGTHEVTARGWAIPGRIGVFVTNLILRLDGQVVYQGRMDRSERPDVAQSLGRPDWLLSGFQIRFGLPPWTPPGVKQVQASVRLSDGEVLELPLTPEARQLVLGGSAERPRLLGMALLAFGLPLAIWLGAVGGIGRLGSARLFAAAVGLAFVVLVGSGLSGSSLGLALEHDAIAQQDSIRLLGHEQAVRSDEWETITPMAISQEQAEPRWPRINPLLGAEGENMLVIGMTGIPVADVSALARPATWGFFAFDLRRALSWYWWFPSFACFLALWGVLVRLIELDWRLAAPLALSFAAAPYSVVYSGWPAYTAFFALAGLLAADLIPQCRRASAALAAGLGLGLSLAGFVLVLYPGWQISLGYLVLPLALALAWSRRARYHWGVVQWVAFGLALLLAVGLLGAWWQGAQDAVQAMRSTVYPGQRASEVGGDIDPWFLVKGLTASITMYSSPDLANASDTGSFIFLLIPLLPALLLRWFAERRIGGASAVVAAYLLWVLAFMFIGFTPALAHLSLWASSTSYRQDLGLGLAQTLLLALLCKPLVRPVGLEPLRHPPALAGLVALVTAGFTAWGLMQIPQPIAGLLNPGVWWIDCGLMAAAAYLLMSSRMPALVALYVLWMLATALPFNPLVRSPSTLQLDEALAVHLREPSRAAHRVAVVGPRVWSMTLPANGVPVVNSVFYYPQFGLWKTLDPQGAERGVYNRYQRLLLVLRALPEGTPAYRIESPRLDEVRLIIDPARFDFRLLGATEVMAAPADAPALLANPALHDLAHAPSWWLLGVKGRGDAAKMRAIDP